MTTSAKNIRFDDNIMWVELDDARILGIPLVWFPKLLRADKSQLENYELSRRGIHWEALDEDISIEGLLAGRGDVTHRPQQVA